jgi:hypothetical protein
MKRYSLTLDTVGQGKVEAIPDKDSVDCCEEIRIIATATGVNWRFTH